MKFIASKQPRENFVEGYRLILGQDENDEENADPILRMNSVRFTSTKASIDSLQHTIEVSYPNITEEQFNLRLERIQSNHDFYATSFVLPIDIKETLQYNQTGRFPTIDIKSVINYGSDEYNDHIMMDSETNLPNMYSYSNINEDYFLRGYKQEIAPVQPLASGGEIFIIDSHSPISVVARNKSSFPNYVEINIAKTNKNILTSVLYENDIYNEFMNDSNYSMPNNQIFLEKRQDRNYSFRSNFLRDLVKDLGQTNENENPSDRRVYSVRENNYKENVNFLEKLKLLGDLQKKSLKYSNYKTLYQNKKVDNETIFYRITKHVGQGTVAPIQTFFVPCTTDVTSFYDSQVKAGSAYVYKVSAFVMVYGVKYRYTQLSKEFKNNRGIAKMAVVSVPDPILMEVPLYSNQIIVAPSPPLSPAVRFINNSNSSNKIKLFLNVREGMEDLHPIKILDSDNDIGYNHQPENENKVRFRSLNEFCRFEIFKLEEKPKSVLDFRSANVNMTDDYDYDSTILKSSAIFSDNVFPNKKYYYMFRTMNRMGMVSNPSPVYEVELLKDADKTKIIASTIHVDKLEKYDSTVSFKNLFQVRPALQHTDLLVSETKPTATQAVSNILNEYSVGVADYPIWGRKLKLRIKSKESGKIIDFNINFELNKKKKTEDFT